jgi:RNA methyltransferase, TrmH family
VRKRSVRWSEGAFVAEGSELVATALQAGVAIEGVYVAAEYGHHADVRAIQAAAAAAGVRVHELGPGVLDRVADTVTPQPVLAVLPLPARDLSALAGAQTVVVCAGVRDPGNAGTVVRCADASGVQVVVFCDNAVDPYNPKAVRSSAGSIFHVPIVVWEPASEVLAKLAEGGLRRLGAVAHHGEDYADLDWSVPSAIVLGNEAAGLGAEILDHLDGEVTVPMSGHAESLNVGMSCAVMCFEAQRQRRLRGRQRGVRPGRQGRQGAKV